MNRHGRQRVGPVLSLEVLRGSFGIAGETTTTTAQEHGTKRTVDISWCCHKALRGATVCPFGQVRNCEPKSAMS